MFPIDTTVVVKNDDPQKGHYSSRDGRVVGHALMEAPNGTLIPMYLIAIHPGFWSENKSDFVSVLVVEPSHVVVEP